MGDLKEAVEKNPMPHAKAKLTSRIRGQGQVRASGSAVHVGNPPGSLSNLHRVVNLTLTDTVLSGQLILWRQAYQSLRPPKQIFPKRLLAKPQGSQAGPVLL